MKIIRIVEFGQKNIELVFSGKPILYVIFTTYVKIFLSSEDSKSFNHPRELETILLHIVRQLDQYVHSQLHEFQLFFASDYPILSNGTV